MKKITKLINILVCGVLIFGMYKIADLQHQINNLRNNISNVDSHLRNDMNNIYNNVKNMLEEESNQLTTNKWEYDSINIENKTVEISAVIIPKEFNPNVTKVKILNDDSEYSLNYSNGEYIAKIKIPLFETTKFTQVQLDDNGTIRTQNLKWNINPRYEALIQTFVRYDGRSSISYGKEAVWSFNGAIDFDIDKKGTFSIKTIELVEMLDGKEINRINVDITAEGQRKYAQELANKGESVPEDLSVDTGIYNGSATFIYPMKKEVKIPNGCEYVLYADIVDDNNLTHRSYLEYVPVTKDGRIDDVKQDEFAIYRHSETHMILNENGEVLYKVNFDLYQ